MLALYVLFNFPIIIIFNLFLGALVAGLDAGLVYSSFPKMGDKYIPDEIMEMTPKVKNLTENPVTAMFNHRVLVCIISRHVIFSNKKLVF